LQRSLRRAIAYQVDDHGLLAAAEDAAAEVGRGDQVLQAAGHVARGQRQGALAVLEDVGGGEEIEVVGAPVAQVKRGQGGSTGEEEALLAAEEGLEHLPLQWRQQARRQAGPHRAIGQGAIPRMGGADPDRVSDPPSGARRIAAW